MSWTDWAAAAFVAVLGGTVVWLIFIFGDAIDTAVRQSRFCKGLRGALEAGQPGWADICLVASTAGVSKQVAYLELRYLVRDLIVGTQKDDANGTRRKLLEALVAEYELEEPFEGLPGETRLELERIQKSLSGQTHLLHPLTAHFKELLKANDSRSKRQGFYTFAGFLFGVFGAGYGVYVSLFPLTPLTAETVPCKPHVELAENQTSINSGQAGNKE